MPMRLIFYKTVIAAALLTASFIPRHVLAEDATLEVIALRHLTVEQAMPLIKPLLGKQGALSGMNNQLIVRTTPANLKQLKDVLARFDVAAQRLLITVSQDVRSVTEDRDIALSARTRRGALGVDIGQSPADGVELRTQRSDAEQNDLRTQQVHVLEGRPAFIELGQSVPVVQNHVTVDGYKPHVYATIDYKDLTTGFSVLPRVNGENVTLEVSPYRAVPSPQGGGNIDIQQMQTTVTGRLGAWLELGGAVQSAQDEGSGILHSTRALRDEQRTVFVKVERLEKLP